MNTTGKTTLPPEKTNVFLESYAISSKGADKTGIGDSLLEIRDRGIFCIADDIGDARGSKIASNEVISSIREKCASIALDNEIKVMATINEAIVRAKVKIQQIARKKELGEIGSTIVVLRLNLSNNSAYIVHAGDSRVYRLRDGTLTQLTRDHRGDPKPEADSGEKNKRDLTRAIGLYERTNLETTTIELKANDIFLLCSRGLNELFDHPQVSRILNDSVAKGLKYTGEELIRRTKQPETQENASLLLVKLHGESDSKKKPQSRRSFDPRIAFFIFGLLLLCGFWFALSFKKEADSKKPVVSDKGGNSSTDQILSEERNVPSSRSNFRRGQHKKTPSEGGESASKDVVASPLAEATATEAQSDLSSTPHPQESSTNSETVSKLPSGQEIQADDTQGNPLKSSAPSRNLDPTQSIISKIKQTGLASALKNYLQNWDKIPLDGKRKLNVLVLKEINELCRRSKDDRYRDGDEIRKIFDQILLIDDSNLQRVVKGRRQIYESNFVAALRNLIPKAKNTCDWEEIGDVLAGNHNVSDELKNSPIYIYADAWCKLSNLSGERISDLKQYVKQLSAVSARIQRIAEINELLNSHLKKLADFEMLPPVECCQQLLLTTTEVREDLVRAADRLSLNLAIIIADDLEKLISSTYPDKTILQEQKDKLNIFKATRAEITTMRKSLNRVEKWIPPEIEIAEFENWSLELERHSLNVRDYLEFVSSTLKEHQKATKKLEKSLVSDKTLISDYSGKLNEIKKIFPTHVAKSFGERFFKVFHPN